MQQISGEQVTPTYADQGYTGDTPCQAAKAAGSDLQAIRLHGFVLLPNAIGQLGSVFPLEPRPVASQPSSIKIDTEKHQIIMRVILICIFNLLGCTVLCLLFVNILMKTVSAVNSFRLAPIAVAARTFMGCLMLAAGYESLAADAQKTASSNVEALSTVEVTASADASAEGLAKPYAGGQVARGARVGLLGTQDVMDTPFSTSAYTSQLIQDQQAAGVADVLLNDPTVRAARGFGNFQEMYVIRGFPVPSDDMTYNGLYGVLPRQYVASELVERVEVLRGANAFLNGGTGAVSGFGIGGTVNVLPKRASNEPLSRITAGIDNGGHALLSTDISRRFGPDQNTGLRLNAARRDGSGTVKNEDRELSLLSIGADFRSRDVRLSADVGYQDHRINAPRPSVTPAFGATSLPAAPNASSNFAQSWTFAKERSTFATARAEFDLSDASTAWVGFGLRNGDEENRLANPTSTAAGATNAYRFDNIRKDQARTAEVGLRHQFATGDVKHTAVVSASYYQLDSRNAWGGSDWSANGFLGDVLGNLYTRTPVAIPAIVNRRGNYADPLLTFRNQSTTVALADTMAFAGDRVKLTVGARHQQIDNREYDYDTGARTKRYDESKLLPMAGVVFRMQPELSLYANYIEGLTAGDTAPWNATNVGQSLAPHVSKQQEAGLKYDGGRIGASVALFSTTKPFGMLNSSSLFVDGGEQRNQGVEFSVFGEAARGVRLLGGLTLLDGKIVSGVNGALEGNRAIGVPRSQATLGADVDVPGVAGLAFNTRVIYTGSQYADANNTLSIPSWTRVDVGARYITEINKQVVTFRARVDNLFDRNYWASTGGYPGYGYLVLGTPRTLTVSATVDF